MDTTNRTPYQRILEYFADAIYEMSNGLHKVRTITIYQNGRNGSEANVLWNAQEWPRANPSGYGKAGWHVWMGDIFPFGYAYNALAESNWRGAGYTLGHEWGHYYYSLYDEYRGSGSGGWIGSPRSSDEPVPNSVMHSQWNAENGNFNWLNFSVAKNQTYENAQYRVYAASGWETLARPISLDPRNGERAGMPTRFYYAELQQVAPGNNQDSPLELPSAQAQARSDLHIVWQEDSSSTPPGFAYRANLVSLSGQEISYPRPSILIASLSKVDLVAKANLTVKLKAPDGNTTSLTLTDDGITPDVLANDGLYTGFMPYNQAGNYEITATFDNAAGMAEFTKSSCNFALGPDGETYDSLSHAAPPPVELGSAPATDLTTSLNVVIKDFKADDHANTIQTATPLLTDNVDVPGRIDMVGDLDMFKVSPLQSGKMVLRVSGLALGMQPKIRLLKADGTSVIGQYTFTPEPSKYFFTVVEGTANTPFYVEIAHQNSNAVGGLYNISIGASLESGGEPKLASNTNVYLPLIVK